MWRNYNICVDSLESILFTASEPLEVNIALPNDDLPNSGTEKLKDYLKDKVNKGIVKRVLAYNTNCRGFGLINMLKMFPPKGKTFIMTDVDMIVPSYGDNDWIRISQKYHDKGLCLTGFDLNTENYLPPNWGFSNDCTEFGIWLMRINTEFFLRVHGLEKNTIDSDLMTMARFNGGGYKIKELQLGHATWSISFPNSRYYDKEYAILKKEKGSSWVFEPRPENMEYELIGN